MEQHPRLEVAPGMIRRIFDRTRHLREPRPMSVNSAPPQALPGNEIPEWSVERGRQELQSLLDHVRR